MGFFKKLRSSSRTSAADYRHDGKAYLVHRRQPTRRIRPFLSHLAHGSAGEVMTAVVARAFRW